jgi:hypothetical protein
LPVLDENDEITECFICHQRNDHKSSDCPNGDCEIKMANNQYKAYQATNMKFDKHNPKAKIRVLVVTILPPVERTILTEMGTPPEGDRTESFSISIGHGAHYAMLAMDARTIILDSGASRSMFANRAMFRDYTVLENVQVYTASGEAIPNSKTKLVNYAHNYDSGEKIFKGICQISSFNGYRNAFKSIWTSRMKFTTRIPFFGKNQG